ncbi:MAG: transporter [Bacteroidota bacterium]|nr:transporter [Bacteroidota bacterium]
MGLTISAQNDEMITDRPDQTESAVTVQKSMFQLETGFLYQYDEIGLLQIKDYVYNTSLIRYGLLDNLELRFGFGYQARKYTNETIDFENTNRAWNPMTFGIKTNISAQKGMIPQLALLTTLNLNTAGDQVFGEEYTGMDLRLVAAHQLNDWLGLGYNAGAIWSGGQAWPVYFYSVSAGISLSGRLGCFAEVYGYLPEFSHPDHRMDAGFTFLILDKLQLDLSGGIGLSEISPDYFIGTGLSWKFRPWPE